MPYKVGDKKVYGLGERSSGFRARSLDGFQDFQKIKAKCLRDCDLFEDDEFSANETSLGGFSGGPYVWKRPKDICRGKKPNFIIGGADRFDVVQGDLGNCWLLAAIADLTLNEDNFKMVVPDDNSFGKCYTGAFHFRFWQFGKWIDVVIDDRLPVGSDGKLAFMKSKTENEFWSPLLEKAYAKLNVSYNELDGGFTFEALEDFTGGFTEVFMMSRLKQLNLINGPDEFYDIIRSSFEKKSVMGSSVKENPNVKEDILKNGLIRGHAYSITGVHLVNVDQDEGKGQVRLFRLRNPWGSEDEWNGDWSDNSECWDYVSEEERNELEVLFDADGEFWISYDDFLENFERIEVCHLTPASEMELITHKNRHTWVSHSINGSWNRGVTAGGSFAHKDTFANNPQYILTIGEPGEENNTIIICLLKKDRKAEPESQTKTMVKSVSLNVFRVDKNFPKPLSTEFFTESGYNNEPLKQLKPLSELREITVRFSVSSGTYVIIPSSVKPNQEGDFLLRVFTEGTSTVVLYDEDVDIEEEEVEVKDDSPEEKEKFTKALEFYRVVAGDHEEISWWHLKLILDKSFHDEFRYEGFGFSEDTCRSMVALADADRSGQLGFYEFTSLWSQVRAWKKIFHSFDVDQNHTLGSLQTNELRRALKAGGYVVNKDILEDIVLRYGDRNGEIFLDKFIVAALKLKTMIELYKHREIPGENRAYITLPEWLDETIYS